MRELLIRTILGFLGAALIVAGTYFIYAPAALIVAGAWTYYEAVLS